MVHRIVVIDDDPDTCEFLAELLRAHQHEVWTASTAEHGVAAAMANDASVVISDIHLPDMSGLEVPRRLHTGTSKRPTCIAVSGDMDGNARELSLARGFLAHLSKPLKIEVLEELLLFAEDVLQRDGSRGLANGDSSIFADEEDAPPSEQLETPRRVPPREH